MYTYDTGLIRLRYTVTDTYRVVKSAGYTLNSSENEFKFMVLQSWRVNSMNCIRIQHVGLYSIYLLSLYLLRIYLSPSKYLPSKVSNLVSSLPSSWDARRAVGRDPT